MGNSNQLLRQELENPTNPDLLSVSFKGNSIWPKVLKLYFISLQTCSSSCNKIVLSKFDTFSIHVGQIARQACLTHQINFLHFLKKKARKHNAYYIHKVVTILIMEKQNVMSVYSAYSWSSYISHIPYMVWQRRVSSIV